MRGSIQQEQNGALHYETRRGEDTRTYREALRDYRLAVEQDLWSLT